MDASLIYISVDYFDTLRGGNGMIRMPLSKLEEWLDVHPGYLIRQITTVQVRKEPQNV